jgi:hypothetical protein
VKKADFEIMRFYKEMPLFWLDTPRHVLSVDFSKGIVETAEGERLHYSLLTSSPVKE